MRALIAKTPLERAKLLEETTLFKNIHAETAATGQTAPPKDLNVDLHFTCFVEAPDASVRTSASGGGGIRLIELDGTLDGPMDHGPVIDFLKVRNNHFSRKSIGLLIFLCSLVMRSTNRVSPKSCRRTS